MKFISFCKTYLYPAISNIVVLTFFSIFSILVIIIYALKDIIKDEFWSGVLVEMAGFSLDILLFGAMYTIYDLINSKKDRIKRYREEIDFFRHWANEKEPVYRIAGNIKLLNKEGVSDINLDYCYLESAALDNVNLNEASLIITDLTYANLTGSQMQSKRPLNPMF